MSAPPPTPTVLIIDDHLETAQLLATLLGRRGFGVVAVCDSEEARGLIDHGLRPNLVVTDYMMPRLNGLDLITELRTRAETESLPVVLLSALRLPQGGDPFTVVLRKPFEPEAFVDLVEELLGVHQAA